MFHKTALCLLVATFAVVGCQRTTVQGPGGKSLTLTKPSDATIERGDNEEVTIVVKRTNFEGPVTVNFRDLPSGVSVVDSEREMEGPQRTFVLSASDNAELVRNHVARVSVNGPDGMTATEEFRISIQSKS